MKFLFENWRKFLKEEVVDAQLRFLQKIAADNGEILEYEEENGKHVMTFWVPNAHLLGDIRGESLLKDWNIAQDGGEVTVNTFFYKNTEGEYKTREDAMQWAKEMVEMIQDMNRENREPDYEESLRQRYDQEEAAARREGPSTPRSYEEIAALYDDDDEGNVTDLFENWRKYLLEQEERKVVTFDFDDTLSKSDFNDETGTWKHTGPYEPMMKRIKYFISDPGVLVYIVTSRYEDRESQSLENEDQRAVQEFLDEHGLNVDGVYFTNGKPKIKTLQDLNSSIHHDDDPEDIIDSEAAGLIAVPSDPYGIFNKLRVQYEKERTGPEEELEEVGMVPMVSLNMQPNGKKEAEENEH